MKELYKKLLAVQQKLGTVSKGQENPYFKSKYADINKYIEVVKPILNEVGLVLIQPLVNSAEGKPALQTVIMDPESGESIEYTTNLILKEEDPQKVGSAITYYRRYALQSLLFIEAQDDDGNVASGKKNKISNDDLPF